MRDIPLGNGSMLVTFDNRYRIRDFYYPHVGQENHAGGRPFFFGVWADGRLSWVHDDGWSRQISYEDDALVSHVVLRNDAMQIEMTCADAVDFHLNVYVRQVVIRNLANRPRLVKLYFYHDFNILGNSVGDTVYFDPATRSIIHYKGPRFFLTNCCGPNSCGISSFATGRSDAGNGQDGTFRDAEDGQLGRNPIAQGTVDSTIEIEIDLDPATGGTSTVHYWIVAGESYDDVLRQDRLILSRMPSELLRRTRDYWRAWATKEEWQLDIFPERVAKFFKRSLLIMRTQIDAGGAVLAANDTDYLQFNRDTYSYCWPRDGALVCHALDAAGYGELSQRFFQFCANVIRPDGYLMHKYNPDGTIASSWLPWVNTPSKLPIQEDESALVLWALWQHYERYRDIEFVRPLYRPLIKRIGDFLVEYRDAQTGLPLPSWDLWEERSGIHAWTCGAVFGGLLAAQRFADMFGQAEVARAYAAAGEQLHAGLDAHMYRNNLKRFVRTLTPVGTDLEPDKTLDMSIMGLWAFGPYAGDDPRVVETQRALHEGLAVHSAVGGIARYENDQYYRTPDAANVPGNPWFITTLWEALYRTSLCKSEEELRRDVLPIIEWAADRALASGVMAEQINPLSGGPVSVSPLTWSHSTFADAVMTYLHKLSELRRCGSCGQAPRLKSKNDPH